MKRLRTLAASIGYVCLAWQLAASPLEKNTPEASSYQAFDKLSGVQHPVLWLDGDWQFRFTPSGKWATVRVPGELAMQGFATRT